MKMQVSLAVALALALFSQAFGQVDVKPLIDLGVSPSDEFAQADMVEDIPPPDPVPSTPRSVLSPSDSMSTAAATSGGEMHAYDFGVSVTPSDLGMRVSGVIVGSPAEAAGVKPNDTIVRVNGDAVGDGQRLLGEVGSVEIERNGRTQQLAVGRVPQQAGTPSTMQQDPPRTVTRYYSVPRTTYSAPQSYRYAPRYNAGSYTTSPRYSSSYYRSASPSVYSRGYSTGSYYRSRPTVSIGIGVGTGGYGRGYGSRYGGLGGIGGYGPGIGYGRGGFGPGYGRGYGGRGYGGGRSGVGISIGGIGIRF